MGPMGTRPETPGTPGTPGKGDQLGLVTGKTW